LPFLRNEARKICLRKRELQRGEPDDVDKENLYNWAQK